MDTYPPTVSSYNATVSLRRIRSNCFFIYLISPFLLCLLLRQTKMRGSHVRSMITSIPLSRSRLLSYRGASLSPWRFRSSSGNILRKGGGGVRGNATLTFVTGNSKKLEEVRSILADKLEIVSRKIDIPEFQGDPIDVAKEKCKMAVDHVKGPVITEDTSLCFNALGGLPGVYIKWFLQKLGHDGLNNLLAAYSDKSAYAQCIFCYCKAPDEKIHTFVGRCPGSIVPARGDTGFGWDPIFQPEVSVHFLLHLQ
mmetsp:Transcript_23909/g.33442  ORF Transcript_23909/g.33442 Transcript_23909/m.33442 type:complete len:253 (-) Transcript_23909:383-1141(-)